MRFEFHAEARIEFLEAVSRYEDEVPGLGARFIAETTACCINETVRACMPLDLHAG